MVLIAVPAGVVTLIGPVVKFVGTVALSKVLLVTLKEVGVPLKLTAVAPLEIFSLLVIRAPGGELVALKLEIAGGRKKSFALVWLPSLVIKLIGPVVAPVGTTTVS